MGSRPKLRHRSVMSENSHVERFAAVAAEEVLRAIYGDDLQGCTVSLDRITSIIQATLQPVITSKAELLELYEKLVEALHLLSTPPKADKVSDANELRSLLSERLDAIHSLTTKTMETTAAVRGKPSPEGMDARE
jgi:hypothetical protein